MAVPPPLPMHERYLVDGRFKLLQHLGSGGMADVYLAEQLSLRRKVALKILKRDLSTDPEHAVRFRREAQLLSTVDHPAVVRVVDFDSGADGSILVMEHVEGERFDLMLRHGPMEPKRAVILFSQLAHGLAAIHARGIVHRDIKPENVIITQGLLGEQARLLDFGIARLVEPERGVSPAEKFVTGKHTDAMMVFGTPAYVSPEQARGEEVDARSDIYSFGVLAYLMLSNALPFTAVDGNEMLKHHLESAPPPLDKVHPPLAAHPQLVALVHKCLEKNPERRFANGAALAQALDQIDSAPIPLSRPVSLLDEPPGSPWFSRLVLVGVSLLIALSAPIVLERPMEHATWAKYLLKAGKPDLALSALESAPSANNPRWVAMRARVLQALGRTEQLNDLIAHQCQEVRLGAPELQVSCR